MMKMWERALLVGAAAAVAVFGVAMMAAALGGPERDAPLARLGGMMVAADDRPTGDGGRGCGGSGLLQDAQAREEMWALRDEHRDDMRAWWDEYGDDAQSEEAQKALDELRDEHRDDMLELFEKYGVTPPDDFGQGGRGDCAGPGGAGFGGCGGRGPDWGGGASSGEGAAYQGGSL